MPKSDSKLAFYLVSYNVIISEILMAKIVLQYAAMGVMHLTGKTGTSYQIMGAWLTLIASIASIIIGIFVYIKGTRMSIKKIKKAQPTKAIFLIIINVLIAPPLSIYTFFLLIFINA